MSWSAWLALVLLALLIIVPLAAHYTFRRRVRHEMATMLAEAAPVRHGASVAKDASSPPPLQATDIAGLPDPVRAWLTACGAVGRLLINAARFTQEGAIRTQPSQPWMPMRAIQYYTVNPPGLIWSVMVRPLPILWIAGRDLYHHGRGRMLIKVLSLVRVVDAEGPEMDQGSLLRFLIEMMLVPSVAVADYVRWEPVDGRRARAVMTYAGVTADLVIEFGSDALPARATAKRYYDGGSQGFSLMDWEVVATEPREVHGLRSPTQVEVIWHTPEGAFPYFRGRIETTYDVGPEPEF